MSGGMTSEESEIDATRAVGRERMLRLLDRWLGAEFDVLASPRDYQDHLINIVVSELPPGVAVDPIERLGAMDDVGFSRVIEDWPEHISSEDVETLGSLLSATSDDHLSPEGKSASL